MSNKNEIISTTTQNNSSPNTDIWQASFYVDELICTSAQIQSKLNPISDLIRRLEKSLSENTAHFDFKKEIFTTFTEWRHDISEDDKKNFPHCEVYRIKHVTFLSWEQQENSKHYRLFLLEEKVRYLSAEYMDGGSIKLSPEVTFKRPLIETELAVRLKYAPFLGKFAEAFNNYLRLWLISIEPEKSWIDSSDTHTF